MSEPELPHGDVIARLLAERYPIAPGERLQVEVDPHHPEVSLRLWDDRRRYELRVAYQQGEEGADPWLAAVDALDALFGQLIDSDRDYRTLPTGPGIEYEGAQFMVQVRHRRPEVDRLAEQLLAADRSAPSS